MPALFIGHGSPMNAISDTQYSQAWQALGRQLPRPRAVLVISAHWTTSGVGITAMPQPETIHDFGGFPAELHAVEYPAPGDPALAAEIAQLLLPTKVVLDQTWGLDHGTWSILKHMYPAADIPVLQLSLDLMQPNAFHYELGQRLRSQREQGILILGSGDVVHNLRLVQWGENAVAPDWATRIEAKIKTLLLERRHAELIDYPSLDPQALMAIPTAEHYLPLLYIAGLHEEGEPISFPVEGLALGTISMLSVKVG